MCVSRHLCAYILRFIIYIDIHLLLCICSCENRVLIAFIAALGRSVEPSETLRGFRRTFRKGFVDLPKGFAGLRSPDGLPLGSLLFAIFQLGSQ